MTDFTVPPPSAPLQTPVFPLDEAWEMLLVQMRAQLERADYNMFVSEARPLDLTGDLLTVSAPSPLARDWLNARLGRIIRNQMAPLLGRPIQLRVIYEENRTTERTEQEEGDGAEIEAQTGQKNGAFRVVEETEAQKQTQARPAAPETDFQPVEDRPAADQCPVETSVSMLERSQPARTGRARGNKARSEASQPRRARIEPVQPAPADPTLAGQSPERLAAGGAERAESPVAPGAETQAARTADWPTDEVCADEPSVDDSTARVPLQPGQQGRGADGDNCAENQPAQPAAARPVTRRSKVESRWGQADSRGGRESAGLVPAASALPARTSVPLAQAESACLHSGADFDIEGCAARVAESLLIEEAADTVEAALTQPGRIVAFPRYELRHIPLVGPEAFFLRLAFLQERFLHTPADGRAQAFETTVEALLRWSNVGRATLHRFKKGDPGRGQLPAAGWFGIEQLPGAPRSLESQQQPPCRYRLQQGIPLTPMDADRLTHLLLEAGIQADPLSALQSLCSRPVSEILEYPPPAPTPEQKRRAPGFISVAGVVQKALGGQKLSPDLRARVQEAANQLADLVTAPQQMVFVSWYFLRHWLPLLGHAAAALVLTTRAQGYYNPQDQELRDEIQAPGGYRQLARVIGLRRDRTIADWLPNIFDRAEADSEGQAGDGLETAESEKWQREQQRQRRMQALVGAFMQVVPGSRRKMPGGHYAFNLRVQIQSEPLTPADQGLRAWVYHTLAACLEQEVLGHFVAWVTSPVIGQLARAEDENDGVGTLAEAQANDSPEASWMPIDQNDGWGILAARNCLDKMTAGEPAQAKMTARESGELDDDGWGILAGLLDDGAGILAGFEMTARELFKGLLRLNTYWESIRLKTTHYGSVQQTPETPPRDEGEEEMVVAEDWDLREICQRNGGVNSFREQILAQETSARPFLSWLLYAHSFKGQGIKDPVGWALTRLRESPGSLADGAFERLSALAPGEIEHLLNYHLDSGAPPMEPDWRFAFRDVPLPRLRELADVLGLAG